jgi:hypothetical protein
MNLPDYWLTRPSPEPDAATQQAFDALLDQAAARGPDAPIEYTLGAPKWQFLCHAAERRGLALHGSGNPAIVEFEPRQSNDLNEFGNQRAVYAAADGIWAMFFAIVDRDRYPMSISNACVRLEDAGGRVSEPLYVFSVSQAALPHQPWRTGTVYLLPRATFVQQAPFPFGESRVHVAQLASLEPVVPLARLAVTPADFPFLSQIRGHDDARLEVYQQALMTGAPWPE